MLWTASSAFSVIRIITLIMMIIVFHRVISGINRVENIHKHMLGILGKCPISIAKSDDNVSSQRVSDCQ